MAAVPRRSSRTCMWPTSKPNCANVSEPKCNCVIGRGKARSSSAFTVMMSWSGSCPSWEFRWNEEQEQEYGKGRRERSDFGVRGLVRAFDRGLVAVERKWRFGCYFDPLEAALPRRRVGPALKAR